MKHLRSNNPQIQGTERDEICDTFEAKGTRLCVNVSSKTKKSSKKAQTPSKKLQRPQKKAQTPQLTLHYIFCYNMTTDNKRQKNNDN